MPDKIPAALRPAVDALLRGGDWIAARDAAIALGASGDPRVVPALCEAVAPPKRLSLNGYWTVREEAARALVRLGDPRAVEPLCALLEDWAPVAAVAAAEALGKFRDARAVEPLCRALQSDTFEVRVPAARALGEIGDAGAVQPLLACLQSTPELQVAAAHALAAIGDRSAVQGICRLLHIDNESVRRNAAVALGNLGHPEALPALQDRLRFFSGEGNRGVRREIRNAIKAINSARL